MTKSKLNELLSIAKQAQAQWDKWESEGAYDQSPLSRESLNVAVLGQNSWRSLHKAIRASEPCTVLLQNGETRNIGTVGILTADQMMYYSETVNEPHTMEGVNLRFVESIEKVESTDKTLNAEDGNQS